MALLSEWPANIIFTSDMSNVPRSLQNQNVSLDDFDHLLNQFEQQWAVREQVSAALNKASAAFAAQYTQPDAYKFVQTCDQLTNFLDLKIQMEHSEQKYIIQILQVACAMHENAINNPSLTEAERSAYYLASTSLVPLSKKVLESGITQTELWCEVFNLSCRAEQALSKAADALGLAQYLDFGKMADDRPCQVGNVAGEASTVPSPVTPSKPPATQRVSVHDVADVFQSPRSAAPKEKALVMMKNQPSKGPALGRAKTMPAELQTGTSSHQSRTHQSPSKARPGGNGLPALQE